MVSCAGVSGAAQAVRALADKAQRAGCDRAAGLQLHLAVHAREIGRADVLDAAAAGTYEVRVRRGVRIIALLPADGAHADRVAVSDEHGQVAVDGAKAQVRELALQARVQHLGTRVLVRTAQGFKYSCALF